MTKYCSVQNECKILKECQEKLNFTTRQYEALQKKYVEVLKLAKENADSYEYCLQELEKELEELKNTR